MARIGKLSPHKATGLWCVRINGKMTYFPKTIVTQEQAQEHLNTIRASLPVDGVTPDNQTILSLFTAHLEAVQNKSTEKNYADKKRYLDRFINAFGKRTLVSIKPGEIDTWLQTIITVRTNGGSRRNAYAHLAACFNWCADKLETTKKPHLKVDRPEGNVRSEEYVIEEAEYKKLLPLFAQPYQDLFTVLWETGARPSEVIDATVDEYKPERHCIEKKITIFEGRKVGHKTAKQGAIRVIILSDEAERIIKERVGNRQEGKIFLPKDTTVSEPWFNESIQRHAKKIGRTKPVCAYSLRHSFAVKHLCRLIPLNIVAQWLGNSETVCRTHYAHTLHWLSQRRDLLNGDVLRMPTVQTA